MACRTALWRRCQVLFLCSPGNPTGRCCRSSYLRRALELAERHDFIVAADECYAEIYLDERAPPPGLLEACRAAGHDGFERCVVFHSLSKRSSVPGLRSGFVCGDPRIIAPVPSLPHLSRQRHAGADTARQHRRLAGRGVRGAQPPASIGRSSSACCRYSPRAWTSSKPDGAFYLWPDVRGDDERFVRDLYASQAVTVLPGSYLARPGADGNPGAGRVRISLVPPLEQCVEAAERIRDFLRRKPVMSNDLQSLQSTIDAAFEFRADITPQNIPAGLEGVLEKCLDAARLRRRRGSRSARTASGSSTSG